MHPDSPSSQDFLKSLGFPALDLHQSFNHFDFRKGARRILVIGPMGSGKTEFSARVWRDSRVLQSKSPRVGELTSTGAADRRNVFFIRSLLDEKRFPDYPGDALAYRGGYERLGDHIAMIRTSFDLEKLLADHPEVGTWIMDEASFYDERLIYVVRQATEDRGLTFIFPTLILNFRKEIFNASARLLLENATDVFPLTAYCEHPDCVEDAFYTYRYYLVDGVECPALYFDPLIIVGGDRKKEDPREPNYCTRCDKHHHLPGKQYTYLTLKPLGAAYAQGDREPLATELAALKSHKEKSLLHRSVTRDGLPGAEEGLQALKVPCLAEKALLFLFTEMNLLREDQFIHLVWELDLDRDYLAARLKDCGRPLQKELL